MPTQLQNGQTLLFIGDSITDCGRRESAGAPLGYGYVRFFSDLLLTREPHKHVRIINKGIGGNVVGDLESRWHDDAMAHQPDWLSIKIGINDLNRHLAGGEEATSPTRYREGYTRLLETVRASRPQTQILLISPFFLSGDSNAPHSYRAKVLQLLPEYIGIVRMLSQQFDTRFLDLQEAFARILAHRHPDDLCPEPVHPHQTGHLYMAECVYAALS